MQENNRLQISEYADRIERDKNELLMLMNESGHSELAERLSAQLEEVGLEDRIKIVFAGQYSAGKSTIISALSGDNTIKIDSNISTEYTKDYYWNGVVLTDTPGLYTENTEHDERSIEMIKKSNLLIYCITSDLFNPYTLEDFKKWAFEYSYSGKLFLVINKMSKEPGEFNSLVENYKESINRALSPNRIDEFCYAFIDAKDYKDGIKDSDQELINLSHFNSFINDLNIFIEKKGELGKFDTPIMILKSSIDDYIEVLSENETDKEYSMLLSRVERAVDEIRGDLSRKAMILINKHLKPILDKGSELSMKIGSEKVDFSEKEINSLVESCCEPLNTELSELCDDKRAELESEIDGIVNSDLAKVFFNGVGSAVEKKGFFDSSENKVKRFQYDSLREIVENAAGKVIKLAVKDGQDSAKFFIKAAEASGSQLHKAVLAVGKKLGYKFKPWQAVNIARKIGNVAKFVAPVLDVVGLALDVKDTVKENQREKEIADAKIECRKSFADIEDDLRGQYVSELENMFTVYDSLTSQVQQDREKVQKLINRNGDIVVKLLDIRRDLLSIQSDIF